ncbi:diacylglycerol kinase family protein [Thermolongibacillus altinsuensis]|uniref:diacylglycerol kinase family protein n=1 Tax=Thermolongibacillus altinsuensis TaxID=575256 RepID=UPI00242A3195|nr:diacylglycerol kinase [Thermolongibacillus altinsuensis]
MRKRERLRKSFSHAWSGVKAAIQAERNMRIHVLMAATVVIAAIIFKISKIEWLILLITIGIVLSLEMINTAIERVVDLATDEYHPLAKAAKDIAAGAVFLFAFISIIIGVVIFIPHLVHFFKYSLHFW